MLGLRSAHMNDEDTFTVEIRSPPVQVRVWIPERAVPHGFPVCMPPAQRILSTG